MSVTVSPPDEESRAYEMTYGIASLEVDGTRARELADQAFARSKPSDDATRRHTLHDVLARPGDEVAVVNQVLLSRNKLRMVRQQGSRQMPLTTGWKLTSLRMIAPKLVTHSRPLPVILFTHRPSPLNMALLSPWRLKSLVTPCVDAR